MKKLISNLEERGLKDLARRLKSIPVETAKSDNSWIDSEIDFKFGSVVEDLISDIFKENGIHQKLSIIRKRKKAIMQDLNDSFKKHLKL